MSGMGRPENLAAGIEMALTTTIAGLAVAIPTMVIAAHLLCPGDEKQRCWIEEVFWIKEGGSEAFFTWGNDPIPTS